MTANISRYSALAFATALAAAIFWSLPALLWAGELNQEVAQLFESGNKSTPAAVAQARALYEQLQREHPKDPRIDYVYALVLARQHKYHDALPLVARYLEHAPADFEAKRLQIWLQIQDRRYSDVLKAADVLSACFLKKPATEAEESNQETARFLGTLFGYLELARPGVIDSKRLMASKNQLLARLGEADLTAFDAGRGGVAEQMAALRAEREEKQKQASESAEKKLQDDKANLQEDKLKIADREEKAKASTEQLTEAQREANVIQQQFNTLSEDRIQLTARITAIQVELYQIQQNIIAISDLRQPNDTRAPIVQYSYGVDFNRNIVARSLAMTLAGLRKQAFDLDRKLAGLQAQGAQAMGKGGQAENSLTRSDAEARRAEKHAKTIEKKIRLEETPAKPRTAALAAKMSLWTTYAPLPYEEETERVLGWFKD